MQRLTALLSILIAFTLVLTGAACLVVQAAPAGQTVAAITAPAPNSTVRGVVSIEGSASHPDFWKYEVHYAPEPNPPDSAWVLIGAVHESPVASGQLELWDTTRLPDGLYALRLRVARRDGNYDEIFVRQIRVANAGPTETPTPAASPTPTPTTAPVITPTPLLPTPTVIIEQPRRPTPSATAAGAAPQEVATAAPTATPAETGEGSGFDFQVLGDAFCNGSKIALGIFLVVGVLALLRQGIRAFVSWLMRRGRRQEEEDEDLR